MRVFREVFSVACAARRVYRSLRLLRLRGMVVLGVPCCLRLLSSLVACPPKPKRGVSFACVDRSAWEWTWAWGKSKLRKSCFHIGRGSAVSCKYNSSWRTPVLKRYVLSLRVVGLLSVSDPTSPHPAPLSPRLSFAGGGFHPNDSHESQIQSLEKRWMEQVGALKKAQEMTEIERSAPPLCFCTHPFRVMLFPPQLPPPPLPPSVSPSLLSFRLVVLCFPRSIFFLF